MSQLNVDNIQNRTGSSGGPNFPSGISVAVGQTAYIHGNLQVDGTETIINTETLNVADKTVGIGSTTNASNTTADGAGIEVFASSSQTGNNKTITWQNSSSAWTFGGGGIVATDAVVGSAVTINSSGVTVTGVVTATSFKGDGSLLTGIDATQIQNGNTSVQTVDTGSDGHVKMTTEGGERLRIGPAGQIGLGGANYGTSGQLLTSAGSGSAPTWTTVSSAPEYAGIASGSIGSGNAVMVHPDGKLGKIELSFTAKDPIGGLNNELGTFPSGSTNNVSKVKVCQCGTNSVLLAYKNESTSNAMNLKMATIDPSTGAVSDIGATGPMQIATFGEFWDMVYDPDNNCAVILYSNNNGETWIKSARNNGGTLTLGSGSSIFTNGPSSRLQISYDTAANKFVLFYGYDYDVSNYATVRTVSLASDFNTYTFGTKTTVVSNTVSNTLTSYDSVNNKTLLAYKDSDNGFKARVATVSGSNITLGAVTTISTSTWNGGVLKFDSENGKFFSMVFRGDTALDSRVLTISGTTVSAGTVNSSMSSNTAGIQSYQDIWAVYDSGLKNFLVGYRNNYVGKFRQVTISGTSLTLGSEQNSQGGNSVDDQSATYVTDTNKVFFAYQDGSNNYGHYQYWQTSNVTTNVTTENFIGFSKAAYTDGQTATIEVSGATNDDQSSLTSGQNYYVQNNGTLGLTAATPKVYAGTAVSSTKLLVGKESAPSPEPMWVTVASHTGSSTDSNQHLIYEDFANQSYKRYKLIYFIESSGSHLNYIGIQVKEGNAWKSQSGSYTFIRSTRRSTSTTDQQQSNENRFWLVTESVKYLQGEITFYNPNGTTYFKNFCNNCYPMMDGTNSSSSSNFQFFESNGAYKMNTNPIQGIRFYHGTISGGLTELDWKLLAAS